MIINPKNVSMESVVAAKSVVGKLVEERCECAKLRAALKAIAKMEPDHCGGYYEECAECINRAVEIAESALEAK